MSDNCRRFLRFLAYEFHYSKLGFCHENWKAFTYSPWLPRTLLWQILYLLYRLLIAIFFVTELIYTGIFIGAVGSFELSGNHNETHPAGLKFFIYLTNLGFTALTLYTVWSLLTVTYRFFQVHVFCVGQFPSEPNEELELINPHIPEGCCGRIANRIPWYQMIHWFLFTIGVEIALGITLLFWTLLYRPGHDAFFFSHTDLVLHLVNGITAVLETWFTGIPIRLIHFVYPMAAGTGYAVFTGIYYAANGTDPKGNHSIYPVLDYEHHPGIAVAVLVVSIFVLVPLLHTLFFLQYLARTSLAHYLRKKYTHGYISLNVSLKSVKPEYV